MLVNMRDILKYAEENNCAIGCINTPNLETLRAVVGAAEELNTPIIIDHAEVHDSLIPIEYIGPYMIEFAKKAKVPVCVHLDHGASYSFVMRAIRMGFTSIMYDCSALPFEENLKNVKEFVKIAHELDITVEAELGTMLSTATDSHGAFVEVEDPSVYYTDPELAARFAKESNVDALAVCFGTMHGIYSAKPILDLERLKAIKEKVGDTCYLVMHGGSGVDKEQTQAAINVGVRKINYYSYMATAVAPKLVEEINKSKSPVYYHDLTEFAYRFMKGFAKDVITVFNNK